MFGIVTDTSSQGNFSLDYSIDDGATQGSVNPSNSTIQIIPMSKLFQVDLDAGEHVLFVNVTSVISSYPVGIDFVAYNSSYDSITDLPSATTNSASSNSSARKSNHTGAIVGGVLGGLVFVAFMALFLFIFRKRAHRQERTRAAAAVIGRNYNTQLGIRDLYLK